MRFIIPLLLAVAVGAGCAPSAPMVSTPPEAAAPQQAVDGQSADKDVTAPVTTSTTEESAPKPTTTPKPAAKKPAPAPKSVTQYVTITDGAFSPQVKAIGVGDKVVWTNKSTKNQTVRSEAVVLFDSGNIPPGATYSHVFKAVGSYPYYSASHAELKGTIIVR